MDATAPGPEDHAGDRPFGPDAASILAAEHWSLLGARSLIWNEAMSRTSLFPTVLSASIIALALVTTSTATAAAGGAVAFVAAWAALVPLQHRNLATIRSTAIRFPSPPGER